MKFINIQQLLLTLILIKVNALVIAEENSTNKNNLPQSDKEVTSLIRFSAPNLNNNAPNSADELLKVLVNDSEHLLLLNRAKGRKKRGNVLFFHAQGENAAHPRLVRPLTLQLSLLGWNVYAPNIAIEDFARKIDASPMGSNSQNDLAEPSTQTNSTEKTTPENIEKVLLKDSNNHAFSSVEDYQKYFDNLCQTVLQKIEDSEGSLIVITNQNSAYWSLNCTAKPERQISVIMLQPQLPISVKNDLETKFSEQSMAIFSFEVTDNKKAAFRQAFEKGLWQTRPQRFNIGMLPSSKLEVEDQSIAKTITGWIEKQKKQQAQL